MNKRTILAGKIAGNMNKRTPQKLPATILKTILSFMKRILQATSVIIN